MNKIEKIYRKFNFNCEETLFQKAMKEYAEYYAHKCLEIATDEAMSYCPSNPSLETVVFCNTIMDIKLPEHE